MKIPSLLITLDDLPPDGLELALNITPEEVAALVSSEGQESPAVNSPLSGTLKVKRLGRRLVLKGGFKVEVTIACDRCLAQRQTALCGEVDESAALALPGGPAAEDDDADEALAVVDGRVDLSGLVAEFFWLAWPFRFICRPDCAGLCVRCGADLNDGSCGCQSVSN